MNKIKILPMAVAFAVILAFGFSGVAIADEDNHVEHNGTGKGYANKSIHGSGDQFFYKHPSQGSFTGPFDYGTRSTARPVVVMAEPTGKCNCFTFDGTKSFDPDRQKITYAWEFGDGQTSDQAVVKHCYEKAGDYTVTLTARDESGEICGNGITTTKVNANFPPTAKAGDSKEACLGDTLSFDASGSTASSYDAKYSWDFGDGEKADGQKVTHAYQKSGLYRVRLWVDDGKNTECSTAQDVISANITGRAEVKLADVSSTCVGRTVRFDSTGSGVSKYTWDFGDGETWTGGANASHVYQKSGTYSVRVTAESGRGGNCSTASDSTTVNINASPIANAGKNLVCCVGTMSSFDGSGSSSPDGKALSYHWDFGDGESAEGAQVSHAYTKPGNYRAVLTVKDNSGSECSASSDSFSANVNTKPEAIIEVR